MNKANTKITTLDSVMNNGRTDVIKPSLSELTKQFVASYVKVKDTSEFGGNVHTSATDLINVAQKVIDSFNDAPFAIHDFILLSTYLDLPIVTVTNFFDNWVGYLFEAGRLKITEAKNSCYEFETYHFVK